MIVMPYSELIAAINAAVTGQLLPSLSHINVKLAKAPMTPNVNSVPADFTVADFPGYAASQISLVIATHIDANGNAAVTSSSVSTFAASGPVTPAQTIYGYWLETAGGQLILAEAFQTPFQMTGTASPLSFVCSIPFKAGTFSATILP